MAEFNINATSVAPQYNQNNQTKFEAKTKPAGNFGSTPGSVGTSDRTSLEIANAHKCNCTEKRTTSLGGSQNTIPNAAKQKVNAEKQNLPPTAQDSIAGEIAKAKKCDCTDKRTTSLGGNQNTIPGESKQKINAEKQTLPPAAHDSTANEIATAKKCDCTDKRTTSLGGNQNTIPGESKQKIVAERLASRFGYESKVSTQIELKNNVSSKLQSVSNNVNFTEQKALQVKNVVVGSVFKVSSNPVQVVSQRTAVVQIPSTIATLNNASAAAAVSTSNIAFQSNAIQASPVQILNTSVSSQAQTVPLDRQNALNKNTIAPLTFSFGDSAGVKISPRFSNFVPVQGQTQNVGLMNQQALVKVTEKITQQVIAKFSEVADKNGVKLTALQKAFNINDPKLIKEMLNVKANNYGYISMTNLRQGIEANFLKHSDLDKMLKAIFGQNFNPEAIEENLSDPLQLFAEYLKEQRRLKILKEHEDRRRRKQQQSSEESAEDSKEEGDVVEAVMAV
jgi:hypothetical protein